MELNPADFDQAENCDKLLKGHCQLYGGQKRKLISGENKTGLRKI